MIFLINSLTIAGVSSFIPTYLRIIAAKAELDGLLYEILSKQAQIILKQITMEDYKIQKATVDSELDRLREIHSNLKAQTSQMEDFCMEV